MALHLRSGRSGKNRSYPLPDELLQFGKDICGIEEPRTHVEPILEAMHEVLAHASADSRIPKAVRAGLRREWEASAGQWISSVSR